MKTKIKIKTTVGKLMKMGLWAKTCEVLGFSEDAIFEGYMDKEYEVTMTKKEAVKIGFISK